MVQFRRWVAVVEAGVVGHTVAVAVAVLPRGLTLAVVEVVVPTMVFQEIAQQGVQVPLAVIIVVVLEEVLLVAGLGVTVAVAVAVRTTAAQAAVAPKMLYGLSLQPLIRSGQVLAAVAGQHLVALVALVGPQRQGTVAVAVALATGSS